MTAPNPVTAASAVTAAPVTAAAPAAPVTAASAVTAAVPAAPVTAATSGAPVVAAPPAAPTARRLLVDVAVPFALYYLLHACGVSDVLALSVGAGFSLLTTGIDVMRSRRLEVFGAITVLALAAGLLIALVSGDPRELLIRNAWISAPFAAITLASLRASRPLTYLVMWMLLRRRRSIMERLWWTEPRFRTAWRRITVMWGILALVDAAARVLVAYRLPVPQVPAVDTAITVVTMLALQVPTHLFLVWSGFWLDLFAHPARVAAMRAARPGR